MKLPFDHDLRIWIDAPTYVALHHLAREDDRSLSEYVRHLLNLHIKQVSFQTTGETRPAPGPARDGERS